MEQFIAIATIQNRENLKVVDLLCSFMTFCYQVISIIKKGSQMPTMNVTKAYYLKVL